MLKYQDIIQSIQSLVPKDTISIQKGSCIRQRFKRSDCHRCLDICPSGALTWRAGNLHWSQDQCQGCLLCNAVCPTGALSSDDVSYVSLLKKLQNIESPVLACAGQSKTPGHARVPCLGVFAEQELLLAFSLALGKTLQLNMTRRRQCHNSAVVAPLENMVRQLPEDVQVKLVFDQDCLDFEERQCNRREFWGLIRPSLKSTDSSIVDQIQISKPPSDYVTKHLPASRDLLLQTIKLRPDRSKWITEQFWPRLHFNDNCQACNMCVAICPTGALSASEEALKPPTVTAERCVACSLCEDFCPHTALLMRCESP